MNEKKLDISEITDTKRKGTNMQIFTNDCMIRWSSGAEKKRTRAAEIDPEYLNETDILTRIKRIKNFLFAGVFSVSKEKNAFILKCSMIVYHNFRGIS